MMLNFANPDMVGHTGVMGRRGRSHPRGGRLPDQGCASHTGHGGRCIITADHGNAETMIDPETGGPFTAHTTNPVPCILIDPARMDAALRDGGRLSDLAPTLLELMELPVPAEMTGKSLLQRA